MCQSRLSGDIIANTGDISLLSLPTTTCVVCKKVVCRGQHWSSLVGCRVTPWNHSCWQQWVCFSVLSIKVFTDRWKTEVFLYPSNNMTFLTCSKIRITTLYLCSDKLKFSSQWRSRLYCVHFINDGTVVADTLITCVSRVSSFTFCSFTTRD